MTIEMYLTTINSIERIVGTIYSEFQRNMWVMGITTITQTIYNNNDNILICLICKSR